MAGALSRSSRKAVMGIVPPWFDFVISFGLRWCGMVWLCFVVVVVVVLCGGVLGGDCACAGRT